MAVDLVLTFYVLFTKSKETLCSTISFEGVVSEISLDVHISLHSDSVNSSLISTDSTVGTQSPENALNRTFWGAIERFSIFDTGMSDVIIDSNDKISQRFFDH